MEVRYVAAQYPKVSLDGGGGSWLTDGKTYVVLEVGANPEGRNWFRVECDDGTPALFDSRGFVLVSNRVPTTWEVELRGGGSLTFGPPEFLQRGFWEDFFDGQPAAQAQYANVVGHPPRR